MEQFLFYLKYGGVTTIAIVSTVLSQIILLHFLSFVIELSVFTGIRLLIMFQKIASFYKAPAG